MDCPYRLSSEERDKASELKLPIAWVAYRFQDECLGFTPFLGMDDSDDELTPIEEWQDD